MPVDLRSQPSGPALRLVKADTRQHVHPLWKARRDVLSMSVQPLDGTRAGMRMQPPIRQAYLVTISYYHN